MKRFHEVSKAAAKFIAPVALILLATLSPSLAGDSADENIDGNSTKNLARMKDGAQIECTTPDGHITSIASVRDQNKGAAALIMDDDSLCCPLQEGQTTFVIKLGATTVLDRFTFVNENATAAGQLKISVSNYQLPAASNKWVDVDGHIAFSKKRLFNLSLVGVEARYVKLAFNVEKAGCIASLGLYGGGSLQLAGMHKMHSPHGEAGGQTDSSAYTQVTNTTSTAQTDDSLDFDFANVYAHARVVYVSSGLSNGTRKMIDDDTLTAFKFAPNDQHPTAIVELGHRERLRRVSAIYKMQSGRLDVYLLNELRSEPSDLTEGKLVASVEGAPRDGKAVVNFDPQGARYVALRWTPSGSAREGFEVAEINAFGDVPISNLGFDAMPGAVASNSIVTVAPSFPTELPTVALVSP